MKKPKNFTCQIDWNIGLMSLLKQGLEKGMWFQRNGKKFFVPANQLHAYFNSTLGIIEIYFWSENPTTMATYSLNTYGIRWALEENKLKNIYKEESYYD